MEAARNDPAHLPRNLVVIPTYDEIGNLDSIVQRTLAVDASWVGNLEILIVDDNRPV